VNSRRNRTATRDIRIPLDVCELHLHPDADVSRESLHENLGELLNRIVTAIEAETIPPTRWSDSGRPVYEVRIKRSE